MKDRKLSPGERLVDSKFAERHPRLAKIATRNRKRDRVIYVGTGPIMETGVNISSIRSHILFGRSKRIVRKRYSKYL